MCQILDAWLMFDKMSHIDVVASSIVIDGYGFLQWKFTFKKELS